MSKKSKAEELFISADKQSGAGNSRSAFRLFFVGAQLGHLGCQLNVGYMYDIGFGVRRNRAAAMHWYIRAYRRKDASAANNIGTIWRDENKLKRALYWFQRAVALGDDDANLEIAKIYLREPATESAAIPYLKRVCDSRQVCEDSAERAKRLLKKLPHGRRARRTRH